MWIRLSLCLMLITMIYPILVSAVSTTLTKIEQSEQKRSPTAFFRLYNIDPKNDLLTNRPYYDDDADTSALFFEKRLLKKKAEKFFHQPQSPYTIAFPALIRGRRWIEREY